MRPDLAMEVFATVTTGGKILTVRDSAAFMGLQGKLVYDPDSVMAYKNPSERTLILTLAEIETSLNMHQVAALINTLKFYMNRAEPPQ